MSSRRFSSPAVRNVGVAIAGVMAMRPEVLILDEPAAGLDPKGREEVLQEICTYWEKTSSTVILVSHSMEDIARFAQRIIVMNAGKVFCYDTVQNVFRQAQQLQAIRSCSSPDYTGMCGTACTGSGY